MEHAMTIYFKRLLKYWHSKWGTLPKIPYDDNIYPFIYKGVPDENEWICWKPVRKKMKHDLSEIEQRVDCHFPNSINLYFNTYWFCSLGGKKQEFGIQLMPVLPGKELVEFEKSLLGYKESHSQKLSAIPIGFESNGLLVVVNIDEGKVQVEDYERSEFTIIATSLEELISEL